MIHRIHHKVDIKDVAALEAELTRAWDDAALLCPFNNLQPCPGSKCAAYDEADHVRTIFGDQEQYTVYGPACFRLTPQPDHPTTLRVELESPVPLDVVTHAGAPESAL